MMAREGFTSADVKRQESCERSGNNAQAGLVGAITPGYNMAGAVLILSWEATPIPMTKRPC